MPGDAMIQLGALRFRQRGGVRFQAFPDRIEQFRLLRRGEAFDLASQIIHMATTLARFQRSGKHVGLDGVVEAHGSQKERSMMQAAVARGFYQSLGGETVWTVEME